LKKSVCLIRIMSRSVKKAIGGDEGGEESDQKIEFRR
jgi:hypothetical protein